MAELDCVSIMSPECPDNSVHIDFLVYSWEIFHLQLVSLESPGEGPAQPGEGEPQWEGRGVLGGRDGAQVVSPLGGQEEETHQEIGDGEGGDHSQVASTTGLQQPLYTHLDMARLYSHKLSNRFLEDFWWFWMRDF